MGYPARMMMLKMQSLHPGFAGRQNRQADAYEDALASRIVAMGLHMSPQQANYEGNNPVHTLNA